MPAAGPDLGHIATSAHSCIFSSLEESHIVAGSSVMAQGLRKNLRVLRLIARHDLRALKKEAESHPPGMARWAHASESWMHGEIAAARQSAEEELRNQPDDFQMLRICLDYQIRARNSEQIYDYARRLLAARNPAAWLRRTYTAQRILLWPLWLLGDKRAQRIKQGAANCDAWVAWAREYVATHSAQPASGEWPIDRSAIAVTAGMRWRHAWMAASIEVSLAGIPLFTTGELKGAGGTFRHAFTRGGQSHEAVLSWGKSVLCSVPYTLEVDGYLVETSRLRIAKCWARYWPFVAALVLAVSWHMLSVSR
jgi:hypothetical protein